MKNRQQVATSQAYSKAHNSDGEDNDEVQEDDQKEKKVVAQLTQEEIERRQLENAPVIGDSEISPAAYLFQNHDEQDDLNLFE